MATPKSRMIVTILAITVLRFTVNAQVSSSEEHVFSSYFQEIYEACNSFEGLWARNLYGPILLVNPHTREIVANQADSSGELRRQGDIYLGKLPYHVNIANTSLKWNGVQWAMIMLPLPDANAKRVGLLAHELFHRSQSDLNLKVNESDNGHLDQKLGRIFLRLEMQALNSALHSKSDSAENYHLRNALVFRLHRRSLFKNSATNENLLELNEGLAEFTASVFAGQSDSLRRLTLCDAITEFVSKDSYIRSFAYCTIPSYGFFVGKINKLWPLTITAQTDLTSSIISTLGIDTNIADGAIQDIAEKYGLRQITLEENQYESSIEIKKRSYRLKFLESPHLIIKTESMNISFDPGTLVSLGDDGTVYPNLRIVDRWGVLIVKNGALVSTGWNVIRVSKPLKLEPLSASGDGWQLEFNAGYRISKRSDGNYQLTKVQ